MHALAEPVNDTDDAGQDGLDETPAPRQDGASLLTETEREMRRRYKMTKEQTARFFGVSRTAWFEYKAGIRQLPDYVRCSLEAHKQLPENCLDLLVQDRVLSSPGFY